MITGQFKWKDYKQQKLESLTMTAAFAGVGSVGKGLSVLNQARKAKQIHRQAKQMMCAAKAAKSANNLAAKNMVREAKKLKKQGDELFQKGKTRLVHKGTDLTGMTKNMDKAKHLVKYTSKKIGSSAVTALSHEAINQLLQGLMDELVKIMMDTAKEKIKRDDESDVTSLHQLFGQLFDQSRDDQLNNFFKEEKGRYLITSLIQSDNPCLSTWNNTSSGFSTLADMHLHSGGSKDRVKTFFDEVQREICISLFKKEPGYESVEVVYRQYLSKLKNAFDKNPTVIGVMQAHDTLKEIEQCLDGRQELDANVINQAMANFL